MNPIDLLKSLKAKSVSVSLNLKVSADTKPSDDTRALIRDNRDALLEHLACEHVGTASPLQSIRLTLYGDLLHSLMVWCAQHQDLHIHHPNGLTLNSTPEHIRDAVTRYPWGIVYDVDCRVLLSWGVIPTSALSDKRDLLTDELLVKGERA